MPSPTWGQARGDDWLLANLLLLVLFPEISLPYWYQKHRFETQIWSCYFYENICNVSRAPYVQVQTPPRGSTLQHCLDQFSQRSHLFLSVSIQMTPHSSTGGIHHLCGHHWAISLCLNALFCCSAWETTPRSFKTPFWQFPWLSRGKLNISIKLCTNWGGHSSHG